MPLAPPPDGAVFASWDDCFRAVQTHAAAEGYAVNAKGQAKHKETGLYRRFVIRCDKSGVFKSTAQLGTRRSSTKKTGCPFNAACNIRPDGCFLRVLVPEHNHPPSALPAAHIAHRKITDEQRQIIEARALERKSVKVIWQELKDLDPNTNIVFKDVDNAVQRFRKKAKEGATGIQAIMYKLVERQDLFCFTFERDGMVAGAFWVPHWSADLWMRPNGTPDILVMLTEHIANRPVLPILEMNSVLNAASFGVPQPNARAMPDDQRIIPGTINPNTTSSPDNAAAENNDGSASPAPLAAPVPNIGPTASNTPTDTGRINNGLDSTLGAGYAILPDKSDSTILWLQSAVEMLRTRIPQCPRPRFLTLTDFQTAEKNILVEVSKGGIQHRGMHMVFGRILAEDNSAPIHHGLRSRKPRSEIGARRRRRTANGGDESHADDDADQEEDEEEGAEGEDEDEDQDMDGDHDSDAEIARQLTSANVHHDRHNMQNPSLGYAQAPQHQDLEQQQPPPSQNLMAGRLPLPGHTPRQGPPQSQQAQAQMAYNGMMTRVAMPGQHQPRPM